MRTRPELGIDAGAAVGQGAALVSTVSPQVLSCSADEAVVRPSSSSQEQGMGRHVSGIPGIRSVAHAAPGAGLGELLRPGLVARGTDYAIGVMEVSGAFAFFCVTKRGG